MDTNLKEHPKLTEPEWNLIIELLEREQGELHPEIHHTDDYAYREKLRHRLDLVNHLLKALA